MRRMRQSTGARVVPMDMCAWYLGVEEGTPGHFHRKRTWWLVSPGLYPWARLFLSRTCPGVGTSHVHVGLKGPSPSVPGHVWRNNTGLLSVLPGAWWCVPLTNIGIGGKNVLTAIDFVASSTGARPVPCLDSCQPWRAFPPPPTRGGGLLTAYHKVWPFRPGAKRPPRPLRGPPSWEPLTQSQERFLGRSQQSCETLLGSVSRGILLRGSPAGR